MFPKIDALRWVDQFQRSKKMPKLLTDVYSIFNFDRIHENFVRKSNFSVYEEYFDTIENLVTSDCILIEHHGAERYLIDSTCRKFHGAIQYFESNTLYGSEEIYDENERVQAYLQAANEAGAYYAPHRSRKKAIVAKLANYIEKTSTTIYSYIDQRFAESDAGQVLSIDTATPPVCEHVLYFSMRESKSIFESINEVRNSKNAINFRRYMTDLDDELKELSPRKRLAALQPLFHDFDKLCDKWVCDIDEGVKYERRRIKLFKIPLIGKLLDAAGMGEVVLKDPILFHKSPHLLFLNDIYNK